MENRGFESLDFYQDSLKLLKVAYRLADILPDYERYNLSDQLRRASCGVLLNIAEGYGHYQYLNRLRFMYIARGSLAETKSAFIIAEKIGFCTTEQLAWVSQIESPQSPVPSPQYQNDIRPNYFYPRKNNFFT